MYLSVNSIVTSDFLQLTAYLLLITIVDLLAEMFHLPHEALREMPVALVLVVAGYREQRGNECLLHVREGELGRLGCELVEQRVGELDPVRVLQLLLPVDGVVAALVLAGVGEVAAGVSRSLTQLNRSAAPCLADEDYNG